jgi:uncharacterized protein YegP (UPF0339 family)
MNAINHLDVYTRADGKYDFRIIAAENGKILAQSTQGYENRSDAVDSGKRVLNSDGHTATDPVVTFDEAPSKIAAKHQESQ